MTRLLLLLLTLSVLFSSCATLSGAQNNAPLTEEEATQGFREVLDRGIDRAIATLHHTDGFWRNPAYKLGFPAEAQNMEAAMRQIGMSAMLDRALLQINRAAEDAVGAARPLFSEAVRNASFTDALSLVNGAQDTTTQYFRQKAGSGLKEKFAPVVKLSLDKFGATKYYEEIATTYNNYPTTLQKVSPELAAYVTDRTLSALFQEMAKEETAIRSRASARRTPILKRVFGRE